MCGARWAPATHDHVTEAADEADDLIQRPAPAASPDRVSQLSRVRAPRCHRPGQAARHVHHSAFTCLFHQIHHCHMLPPLHQPQRAQSKLSKPHDALVVARSTMEEPARLTCSVRTANNTRFLPQIETSPDSDTDTVTVCTLLQAELPRLPRTLHEHCIAFMTVARNDGDAARIHITPNNTLLRYTGVEGERAVEGGVGRHDRSRPGPAVGAV